MSLNRPSLSTILERMRGDADAHLPGVDPRLRKSVLDVLLRTLAGAVHGMYGYMDFIAAQVIVDTAEAEYLDRWGAIWGITRKAPTAAAGSVTFTGTDGSVIPAGTTVQRSDGVEYTTDAAGTIAAGTVSVAVTATVAGSGGNADPGTQILLPSPLSGVNGTAAVAAGGLTGGTDAEGDTSLRARLVARIQRPPHGGTAFDYVAWALEVAGVTRAWVLPATPAAGQATVLFAVDNDAAGPIPSAGQVAAVQAHIDPLAPVTADIIVQAPAAATINFTIATVPNTAAVQAAIQAELADLILRRGEPGGTVYISHIREAISRSSGEENHSLVAPAADVVIPATGLGVMGAITWQ